MSKGIQLHVWGDYALFTRPEMKVERVSYDVITPSSARAIISSIYWKPQIEWIIDRIHVLKPIVFTSVRRNEVSCRETTKNKNGFYIEDKRQQRASLILKDVAYVLDAHFVLKDNKLDPEGPVLSDEECQAKHISIFNRRAKKGQFFQQPYFGCREFPVNFRLIENEKDFPQSSLLEKNKDFGYMFNDFVYRETPKGKITESWKGKKLEAEAHFFRARMINGTIEVPFIKSQK